MKESEKRKKRKTEERKGKERKREKERERSITRRFRESFVFFLVRFAIYIFSYNPSAKFLITIYFFLYASITC